MNKKKIKIWVTGATGQLGMSLQELGALHHATHEVIFTTREEVNIADKKQIQFFLTNNPVDFCVNTAAYTNVDGAEEDRTQAFSVNAESVKGLAEACNDLNVCLIHISTDFVFDGNKKTPYLEGDKTKPINVYGASKRKGEIYIQETGTAYYIIRTSWLYSSYGKNFVNTILRLGKEKKKINVVNDQIGSPTYGRDLAAFIYFLTNSTKNEYGIYHFSNKGEISWYDFAKEIIYQAGIDCEVNPISSEGYKTLALRPKYSTLSTQKIEELYKFTPSCWKESLAKCLKNLT